MNAPAAPDDMEIRDGVAAAAPPLHLVHIPAYHSKEDEYGEVVDILVD